MNETLGTEIDRRKVGTEALRQVGEHMVPVRLNADYHPEFRVVILQEGAVVETAAPVVAEVVEEAAEVVDEAVAEAEA